MEFLLIYKTIYVYKSHFKHFQEYENPASSKRKRAIVRAMVI